MSVLSKDRIRKIEEMMNHYIVKTNAENNIIFNNLDLFCAIADELLKQLPDIDSEEVFLYDIATKSDVLNNVCLIREFFRQNHIKFDLDEIIQNGVIELDYIDEPNYEMVAKGSNYYIDNHKAITSCNNGFITDAVVLFHEISHYRNQPEQRRNQTNCLLTETVAYAEELVFLEFLKEEGYEAEVNAFQRLKYSTMAHFLGGAYSIFKMVTLYKNLGSISEESYQMFYKDDYYEVNAFNLDNAINHNDYNIYQKAGYVLAYFLGPYICDKYQENPNFMAKIQELHTIINQGDMLDFLRAIDLSDLDEPDFEKVRSALTQFKQNKMFIKTK